MGSTMSSGRDNNELVNLLLSLNHMSSKNVEIAFRAVDRGDYISASHRDSAYRDISCKVGNIHLSAPCVYSSVMEGLSLRPGLSFLNIGSGTGYLSTIAGLILGDDGTNHGIEMHEDCLIYAQEHLEEFKRKSLDVDVFEFSEPVFQLGNILNVMPNRQYDRVYCGAACPEVHEKFIKQFVKIGGILVMPYKDQLLRSKRTGKETWRNNTMLPVSFTTLMSPEDGTDRCLLQLPSWTPRSLQELCRSLIRRRLRKMVWAENKNLVEKQRLTPSSEDDEVTFLGWQSEVVIPIGRDGLMNASAPRILEECLRLFVTPDMMNDSDDTETETEGLFAPSCHANPFTMRERLMSASTDLGSNDEEDEDEEDAGPEAGAKEKGENGNTMRERLNSASTYFGSNDEDDEDAEDAGAGAKKKEEDENTMDFEMDNCNNGMQDIPMEDETESADNNKNSGEREIREENGTKQSGSKNVELSSCRKKRNAAEKSNDSSDDAESFTRGSLKNGAIKSSVHKRALLKMESLKELHSDSSESLSDGETPDKISRSIATNSKNVANAQELRNESISSEYDFETEQSPPRPSFSPFSMTKHLKNQTTKTQSLSDREKRDGDDEHCGTESAKIGDKNERIEDSSNLSSSEDEHEKASAARSDYRACLKRRSERKSTCSGTDGSSIFGKKSNISNESSENSPSSGSNGTCNSEGISSTSGSERSSHTAAINSIISETSEFSTSDSSSSDNYCSDSDQDFFLSVRDSNGEHTYAHHINKDLIASCMKKKVMQLPLPPPLLLYINYNRELV